MPASEILIFNKKDHLPGILVEEGLAHGDVVDGNLDATNIGTHLCDVVHGVDFSNSLDQCKKILWLLLAIVKLFSFCSSLTSFFAAATKIWSSCRA
jgi:hypothetical protein